MKEQTKKIIMYAVIALLIVGILLSFWLLLLPKLTGQRTERAIVKRMDFQDSTWISRLMEQSLPLCQSDFLLNAAYVFDPSGARIVIIYATQADMDAIRQHYAALMPDARLEGANDSGNVHLSGTIRGRAVEVNNFFSEVTSIIRVSMAYDGPEEPELTLRVREAFPEDAFLSSRGLGEFDCSNDARGYVLYEFNSLSDRSYPGVPIFSRTQEYNGSLTELTDMIGALSHVYTEADEALHDAGEAYIRENGYLMSVSAQSDQNGVFCVLTAQKIPES